MSWIKIADHLPEDEQWCWIYVPENVCLCACYDRRSNTWYIPGLDFNCGLAIPSHWQSYYTPAFPDVFKEMESWERLTNDV